MGKLPSLSKLKVIGTAAAKGLKKNATLLGVSTAAGAAAGFTSGLPGQRTQAAKEGALAGAATVGGYLTLKNKTARSAIAAGAKAAGNVVFRRVGGRVVPIRGR